MSKEMLNLALSRYGVAEIQGEEHNEEIVSYFAEIDKARMIDENL